MEQLTIPMYLDRKVAELYTKFRQELFDQACLLLRKSDLAWENIDAGVSHGRWWVRWDWYLRHSVVKGTSPYQVTATTREECLAYICMAIDERRKKVA